MAKETTKAVFARLPTDEAEWLADAAKRSDLTVSQVVRRFVRDAMSGRHCPDWLAPTTHDAEGG